MPRLKGMPHPKPARIRRTLTAITAALIAAAALVLAGATHTRAATTQPVYQGTGWKAFTEDGIYSLSPDPYTIEFADTTARTQLTRYLTGPATQVTTTVGVPITVTTTIDTTPIASCPAHHVIVVHYSYRPASSSGMSQTLPCYTSTDGSAAGGHILMDSEYWTTSSWFSSSPVTNDARRKDAVTHELGHVLGLAHPNADINRDGTVSDGECVTTAYGLRPLMCSPNRGNPPFALGGKFSTEFDLPGLRQMLANYYLRQS